MAAEREAGKVSSGGRAVTQTKNGRAASNGTREAGSKAANSPKQALHKKKRREDGPAGQADGKKNESQRAAAGMSSFPSPILCAQTWWPGGFVRVALDAARGAGPIGQSRSDRSGGQVR